MAPMGLGLISLGLNNGTLAAVGGAGEVTLTVVSLTPADEATGVATDVVLIIEFSGSVTIDTGNVTLQEV